MHLRLAVAVMLLVFVCTSLPVPGQSPNHSADRGQSVKNHAHPNEDATPKPHTQAEQIESKQHQNEGGDVSSKNAEQTVMITKPISVAKDWADYSYWGFAGLLVLVGAAQVWLLCGTLKITRLAAVAAKRNAHAARLNAQAIIDSERPWVLPQISRVEKRLDDGVPNCVGQPASRYVTYFTLQFDNAGKTPAQIISSASRHLRLPWGQEPQGTPDYGVGEYLNRPILARRTDKWSPETCSWYIDKTTPAAEHKIKAEQEWLWWYGRVVYRNLLDSSEHETRFCYLYSRPCDEFIVSGPPEYTQYT